MKKVLVCLLLAAGTYALLELGMLLRSVRNDLAATLSESKSTLAEARGTIADLHAYAQEQLVRLRDPRNSKAIDAAIQTAAVFNGTGRLINKVLVPKAATVLDDLSASARSLDRFIATTDDSVNRDIVPEAVQNLKSSDVALNELTKAVQDASERANASIDSINALLSDPSLRADQQEVLAILKDVHGVTSDFDEATDQLPEIADDLAKISKTSQKFAKPLMIARIVSLLAWLVPWLQ